MDINSIEKLSENSSAIQCNRKESNSQQWINLLYFIALNLILLLHIVSNSSLFINHISSSHILHFNYLTEMESGDKASVKEDKPVVWITLSDETVAFNNTSAADIYSCMYFLSIISTIPSNFY